MSFSEHVEAKVNFFASHAWSYGHRRNALHSVLNPWMRGVDFEDYSISGKHRLNTETDPELGGVFRDLIQRVDALIIMAGMYSNNRPWMLFEIDMAFAFRKPIIPLLALGQERVPRHSTRLATFDPVRWRGDSIREVLLQCVSPERRIAIKNQVHYRALALEEAERKRRVNSTPRIPQRSAPYVASRQYSPPFSPAENAVPNYPPFRKLYK